MTQGFTKGVPIDTDPTLGLNSNQVVPSQAAVVTYVTNAVQNTALPSTSTENQILLSNNLAPPEWSTATYPATAATGDIIYASATNVLTTLAAGSNAHVLTLSAGVPVWAALGPQVITLTALTTASTPYTALAADYYFTCDVSGGVLSILLPNAPTTGRTYVVKDAGGDAATNNITVTTVGGVVNIDGATTFVMNTDYESANFVFNGVSYEVY